MGRRAGVNPLLVLLGLLEAELDPQWYALLQTVRDIRSFAPQGFMCESVAPFALTSSTGWVDVFTDGSCAAQTEHLLRFAAWSVVVAAPFHANWNFDVGGVLASNVLPGYFLL